MNFLRPKTINTGVLRSKQMQRRKKGKKLSVDLPNYPKVRDSRDVLHSKVNLIDDPNI